jgi:precorrin-2 dehydrogenase / sirohydrochlorin ferrochelatase
MKPYPIFLINLADRHCIVIGGGSEAEYKMRGLLDCDATVTVISPTLNKQMQTWAEEGRFIWLDRDYQPGDLHGAFLVIAEHGDAERNGRIYAEAQSVKALVNVNDDVTHCNYVAGSVVRQGPLALSISTSGCAPALSVRLRQRFEKEFGPEYDLFLRWLGALRRPMVSQYSSFAERRKRWYQVVDSDVLTLLREGKFTQARERLVEITGIDTMPATIMEA